CWLACPMPVCELLHTSGRAIFGRGLSVRVFEIASQRSARPGLGIEIASDPPSLGNYTTRKRRLSLDHSRALPQGDGGAGPAFAGGAVGGERNLVILDAGDVLHDAFAVRRPGIDAEGEVSS